MKTYTLTKALDVTLELVRVRCHNLLDCIEAMHRSGKMTREGLLAFATAGKYVATLGIAAAEAMLYSMMQEDEERE